MELKKYRQLNRLTQQDVANLLQIPLRTYANYELNSRKPTPEMLCQLADVFGVTVDELLGRTTAPQLFDNSRVSRPEVLELYESLTPELQEHALAILHGLADRSAVQNSANVNVTFADGRRYKNR